MALNFPDIDPVALAFGPLEIRWYSLAYLAGFLLGWRYALYIAGLSAGRDSSQKLIQKTDLDDFLPWAVLGVILGGRLGYVLFYQSELYLSAPWEVLKIWNGGMSFHGGALGVIVSMVLFAWKRGLPVLRLTDIICAVVPVGLFFGRLANFVNGELFGRATDKPWGVLFPYGGDFPRHPSQLYEAALEGVLLAIILAFLLHRREIRERPGLISAIFLLGYAASRMTVEFFREPDPQIGFILGVFTMGQVLCLPMIVGAAILILYALRKGKAISL